MNEQIHYECQRCGNCCRWPGFVKIEEREIGPIAAHVGMDEHTFIQERMRLRPQRDGLALIDKPNGECFYFENGGCVLQAVKPAQCRAFPNSWNFPGWREVCEAKPTLVRAKPAPG